MKSVLNIVKDLILFKAPKDDNKFLLENIEEDNYKSKEDSNILTSDINKKVLNKNNSR